jgi:hypothetical protein
MLRIFKPGALIVLTVLACTLSLNSCDNKTHYDKVRKQVLDLHDKVMADGGKAENYEMQFDTLLKSGLKQLKISQPSLDTAVARTQIQILNKNLGNADNQMENWMHAYNNNFKGKSDQETFHYFTAEKLKIAHIDSIYNETIKPAYNYLEKLNIKPDTIMGKMKM